ncbi:MAG: enediyne biosynthesis protein UnbU, partial [Planctomycetota bacterium]|nr:enediyne biosynthesis protein UnbU [Planctomycetota bacterium]
PLVATLVPMTSAAFILFTLYMIPDPATTPKSTWGQIAFGAGNAAVYGVLQVTHVVFGLFLALTITCAIRGVLIVVWQLVRKPALVPASVTSTQVTSVAVPQVSTAAPA